jgi:hypothetical protein
LGIYFEEKIEEYVLDWKNTRWKKIQNKLKFISNIKAIKQIKNININ